MLRSPPMSPRELLTTRPIPVPCAAQMLRHRLPIHSMGFARFEIIGVQSARLTREGTVPGQLTVQSSWAPPGHTSSLGTRVFATCLPAVAMHTQTPAAVPRLLALYYLCQP